MITRTIVFNEEAHSYTDEFNINYTSVTQLIGKVEPKYDTEFWAIYRVLDQGGYKPKPNTNARTIEINYEGGRRVFTLNILKALLPVNKKVEAVKDDWEDIKNTACRWGTMKHNFLEDALNDILDTDKITIDKIKSNTKEFGYAFKVVNRKELNNSPLKYAYPSIYEIICQYIDDGWTLFSEKRVYDAEYQIAGTIDLLLVKEGQCFIIDWKTNREPLKFEPGYYRKVWNADRTKKIKTTDWVSTNDKLLDPLRSVKHCKGSTYILQLSLYHYLCYRWGLKPVGTLLVHIKPKLDKQGEILLDKNGDRIECEPEFFKLPIWRQEVKTLCEWHKMNLNK